MKYILLCCAVLSSAAAVAQTPPAGDVNRSVEVNKTYLPDVGEAAMLPLAPRMTDTVTLRPEIGYSINALPWLGTLGVTALNPVKVYAADLRFEKPVYLKLGMGLPLRSLADVYVTGAGRQGDWGVRANHYGEWGKLENDAREKVAATSTWNSLGVYGTRRLGKMKVEGEVGYDYNLFSRYGQYVPMGATYIDGGKSTTASYSSPYGRFVIGHGFNDLSYFNFRIGADAYYYADRENNSETGVGAFVEIGKAFGNNAFTLRGAYNTYLGGGDLKGVYGAERYGNDQVTVAPTYSLHTEKFMLTAGADIVWDDQHEYGAEWYVIPRFMMSFNLTKGYFVPYIEITGAVMNCGYRNNSLGNPYVMPGLVMPNTLEQDLLGGISGSISSAFSYKAYAGVVRYKHLGFNISVYDPAAGSSAEFDMLDDKATMFTVGGEIKGRISGSFNVGLRAAYYGYSLKNYDHVGDRPNFDASLEAAYNYRKRFNVRASVGFTGRRYFYNKILPTQDIYYAKADPAVCVNLDMDYRINSTWGVFLQGHNLANAKLYPYNHYAGHGVNVMAGVKLTF